MFFEICRSVLCKGIVFNEQVLPKKFPWKFKWANRLLLRRQVNKHDNKGSNKIISFARSKTEK